MDTGAEPLMGIPLTAGIALGAFTVTHACVGCGACLRTCPEQAIRPAAPGSPAPLLVLPCCSGCGECAEICPVDACVEVPAR